MLLKFEVKGGEVTALQSTSNKPKNSYICRGSVIMLCIGFGRIHCLLHTLKLFVHYNFKYAAVAACIFLLRFLGLLKHTLMKFSRTSTQRSVFLPIINEK